MTLTARITSGVLDDVPVTAPSHEVTGVVGPNGAGKSTLLRALAGLGHGTVTVDGRDMSGLRERDRALVMATVWQDTAVDFDITVGELAELGRHPHIPRFARPCTTDRAAVARALDLAGVTHLAHRAVPTLSGGERQLAQLARALAQETPVLLLDEPVAALDLAHTLRVLQLMRELAADGRTIITVLHDLTMAARFCDRLVVLDRGRARAAGPPVDVLTPELLSEVWGVTATIRPDPDTGTPRVTPIHTT